MLPTSEVVYNFSRCHKIKKLSKSMLTGVGGQRMSILEVTQRKVNSRTQFCAVKGKVTFLTRMKRLNFSDFSTPTSTYSLTSRTSKAGAYGTFSPSTAPSALIAMAFRSQGSSQLISNGI